MKIEVDANDDEVAGLRGNPPRISVSLRDKLADAVHVLEPGWYEVAASTSGSLRAYWWNGSEWLFGPSEDTWIPINQNVEPVRLHRYDEC